MTLKKSYRITATVLTLLMTLTSIPLDAYATELEAVVEKAVTQPEEFEPIDGEGQTETTKIDTSGYVGYNDIEGREPGVNGQTDPSLDFAILEEVEEKRTEKEKTFLLDNGNYLIAQYEFPVHFQNAEKQWLNYDNTLEPTLEEVETIELVPEVSSRAPLPEESEVVSEEVSLPEQSAESIEETESAASESTVSTASESFEEEPESGAAESMPLGSSVPESVLESAEPEPSLSEESQEVVSEQTAVGALPDELQRGGLLVEPMAARQETEPDSESNTQKLLESELEPESTAQELVEPEAETEAIASSVMELQIAQETSEEDSVSLKQKPEKSEKKPKKVKKKMNVYRNQQSHLDIAITEQTIPQNMVSIKEDETSVSWSYVDSQMVVAEEMSLPEEQPDGNDAFLKVNYTSQELLYPEIYENVDLACTISPIGIKENYILADASAQNTFQITYDLEGLTAQQVSEKIIYLKDGNGDIKYVISAPLMKDGNGAISEELKLTILSEENNQLLVELWASQEWLQASDRVYPVTVDPSFTTSQNWGTISSAFVSSRYPTRTYGQGGNNYEGSLYVGQTMDYGKARSYLKLNSLPKLNSGDVIVGAHLSLLQKQYGDIIRVDAHEVTSAWTQSTICWNTGVTNRGTILEYVKQQQNDTTYETRTFDLTKLVKGWYDGKANNGVVLRSTSENSSYVLDTGYYSGSYPDISGIRPVFTIQYRNNKGLEPYWTFSEYSAGNAGTADINNYSGNLVFSKSLSGTSGLRMPVSISAVYNGYLAGKAYGADVTGPLPYVGRGWKLNIQQTLLPSSKFGLTGTAATDYPYVYTDGDGTDHYFYKKTADGKTQYLDEDGLGLELTISTTSTAEKFSIKDKDNNIMLFNSTGYLVKMKDKNVNTMTVVYHTDGKTIKEVVDGAGKKVIITLNDETSRHLRTLTDPAGRKTTYAYASGLLAKVTHPDGTTSSYTYDADKRLSTAKDAQGNYLTFTYSSAASGSRITAVQQTQADGTAGPKVTYNYGSLYSTVIRDSGNDGVYNNSDDLISTYQFDTYGRTTGVKRKSGRQDMEAEAYAYTTGIPNSTGSNIKQLNKVTAEHSINSGTVNLLQNHNMEQSGSWTQLAWNGANTFTMAYTTEQSYFGKQSLKLNSTAFTGTSGARARQDLVLTPGKTYTLSGYIKTVGVSTAAGDVGAMLFVDSFDSAGKATSWGGEYIKGSTPADYQNGWRRTYCTFTVPANSAKIRIHLILRASTGSAYFDGIQLEEGGVANPYNMIKNPGLEQVSANMPVGWNGSNLSVSATGDGAAADQKYGGSYSLRIKGDPALVKEATQTINIKAKEEDCFIVSGWAKASAIPNDEKGTRRLRIAVKVTYSDGSSVFKNQVTFNHSITDWQFASSAFNLSDGTSTVKTPISITLYLCYHSQANTAYFDNLQLIREPSPTYTYNTDGDLVTVTENASQNSKLEYQNGNLIAETDAKGYKYTYTYDGKKNVTKATSQNGLSYNYTYNGYGQGTALDVKNNAGDRAIRTGVDYTSDGAFVSKVYDQDGVATSYNYNANTGTLTSVTDPNGKINYTYNPNNDLSTKVAKTLSNGQTVSNSYGYDAYNRLTDITHNGTAYNFAYDKYGNVQKTSVGSQTLSQNTYTPTGVLTRSDYGNGAYTTYGYDDFGNVTSKALNGKTQYTWSSNRSGSVTKHEDLANNLIFDVMTDTLGRSARSTVKARSNGQLQFGFDYRYDLNNNLDRYVMTSPTATLASTFTYGKDNLLTNATIGNANNKVTYQYDSLNRFMGTVINTKTPIEVSFTRALSKRNAAGTSTYRTTKVNTETLNGEYHGIYYDDAGNIIRMTGKNAAGTTVDTQTYAYDQLSQLVRENDIDKGFTAVYTYDNGGNILQKKVYPYTLAADLSALTPQKTITYQYGDTNWKDKLTSYNGQAITYDQIGNPLTYRDGMTMTWTNGRRMASLNKSGLAATYSYDADGLRLKKVSNGVTSNYYYDGGQLAYEKRGAIDLYFLYDGNGTPTALYSGGKYYYYMVNSRGDVVALFDSTGKELARYNYDAWGNCTVTTPTGAALTDATHIANINPLRYRGYYLDTDTGLYYLQSRYYDPQTHRYLNADAVTDGGAGLLGQNLFIYAANNPIMYSDPSGNWIISSIFNAVKKVVKSVVNVVKSAVKWVAKKVVRPVVKTVQKKLSGLGGGTISTGHSLSASPGVFTGSVQLGASVDYKGNFAVQYGSSGGVAVGHPGASFSRYFSVSNAPDTKALLNQAYQIGANVIPKVGGTVEANLIQSNSGVKASPYIGATGSLGVGAELNMYVTWSAQSGSLFQFNIFEEAEKIYVKIMDW